MTFLSRSFVSLLLWVGLCVGGGALVGITTSGGDSAWYQSIPKPEWTPPGWVFAPVWTTLYALMGVAAWLVWRKGGWSAQAVPLRIFLVQLTLNFAWSFLFFTLHRVDWALADIALLWATLAVTIRTFAAVDVRAGWLLAPYLAWVSFAAGLNLAIYRLQ